MKTFFAVLLLVCSSLASASWRVTDGNLTVQVSNLSCSAFMSAGSAWASVYWPGHTVSSCTSDPVANGTQYTWTDGFEFYLGGTLHVSPVCETGTHLDTSTNTCVDDIATAIVSCLPSIRTISPCPSGFAPTNAIPQGSGAPDPYLSQFDSMPLQDMLYAMGVCLFGLLGIGVGVKLT